MTKSQIKYNRVNNDQIDCFLNGEWCGLIQKDQSDWYISNAMRFGKEIDLIMGTKFLDGTYFFGGTLAQAKKALSYELNA